MKLNYIYTAIVYLLFVACSGDASFPDHETTDPVAIELNGTLHDVYVEPDTRGTGPITGTKPSSTVGNLSLDIFRADATSGTTYGTTYTSTTTATMTHTTGAMTFTTAQYYLVDPTRSTKLIGLYPSGGTYASAGRTVTYSALDGGTDIMVSTLVEGNRSSQAISAMTFGHMLTQVKVNVIAQNAAAITAWGNVTGITISDKKIGAVVTLPTPSSGTASIAAATGTVAAMPLTSATGGTPSSMALTTGSQTFGYAMFLPVTTAGKLTFNITTATGGTQSITTTTSQTFVASTAYEITITFSVTGISATATLTNWSTGNTITETL